MLDEEFKKQRAKTVRSLAEKAIDPFIYGRWSRRGSNHDQ
jgi:hypothetical protein